MSEQQQQRQQQQQQQQQQHALGAVTGSNGGSSASDGAAAAAAAAADAAPPARPSIKSGDGGRYSEYQRRRRDAALEAQRAARGARLQLMRMLAAERQQQQEQQQDVAEQHGQRQQQLPQQNGPGDTSGMALDNQATEAAPPVDNASFSLAGAADDGSALTGAQLREHYARQLMQPEWLTDVPGDLARAWMVMPRPEGRRCLAIAAHGSTVLRSRTGALLGRVQSALPGGSRAAAGGVGDFTIVDGVLAEGSGGGGGGSGGDGAPLMLYVADVVAWRGVALADCSAECRLFWLAGNLPQLCGGGGGGGHAGASGQPQLELQPLPALPADARGLEAAARGGCGLLGAGGPPPPPGFFQDGVLLLHRECRYAPGTTPLALLWKDAGCSRYLLDTDAGGTVPDRQAVVLRCRADLTVATDDDPPVPLGALPADWAARIGPKLLRAGRLLRFSLGARGVLFGPDDGRPYGADLRYEGPANARRGRADAFSKVLFQALARAGTAPTLEALKEAAAAGAGAMDADGGTSAVQ